MLSVLATVAVGLGAGLAAVWLGLLVVLWAARPARGALAEAVRLLPDVVRLVARLARDRATPRRARAYVWVALGYLAMPVDLVPDVIPGIGLADDVILVLLMLRLALGRAGLSALDRHWPGTYGGRSAVVRLLRLDR